MLKVEEIESLAGLNWQGIVVLEYLPEYHHRIAEDIQGLKDIIGPGHQ